MNTETPAALPLVRYLIDFMRDDETGVERYAFAAGAADMLEKSLDVLFELMPDPEPTLDELVKFTCALELEMMSPSAAALVRAVLYADPRVLAVFGKTDTSEVADEASERYGKGREVMRAPMFGEDEPVAGTIKAGSLADAAPRGAARNGCIVAPRKAERAPAVRRAVRCA